MSIIEVKDLSFSYTKEIEALKKVSFKIEKGSYTTIIGHNGSGKSTIAKLLAGLLVPNGGEIGWLAYNDAGARQGFGDAFCDAVLAMQPGQVSDVLESNVGYHIVKVSVHNPAKILTLDDNIAPDQNVTVRQFISQLLTERQMQVASSQALQDMVEELRSEARINILYNGTAN